MFYDSEATDSDEEYKTRVAKVAIIPFAKLAAKHRKKLDKLRFQERTALWDRLQPTAAQIELINFLDEFEPIPVPIKTNGHYPRMKPKYRKGKAGELPQPVDRKTYENQVLNPDIVGFKIEQKGDY
jgi:hypothetical protein